MIAMQLPYSLSHSPILVLLLFKPSFPPKPGTDVVVGVLLPAPFLVRSRYRETVFLTRGVAQTHQVLEKETLAF